MSKPHPSTKLSVRFAALGLAIAVSAVAVPQPPPTWDTWANPLDPSATYHDPGYPLAFVAVAIREDPISGGTDGNYHHGTDVLSVNNPDAENHLWVLNTDGNVVKLFPLDIHETLGLIETPAGELWRGSVLEPNVSEDGNRLYFGYVHDATDEFGNSNNIKELPKSGSDLYAMDIGPLRTDPTVSPDTLDVYRLTDDHAVEEHAMNQPVAAATVTGEWAPSYIHAVEMRTADGLKIVYSSDERSLQNSNTNFGGGDANHNFNLHIADLVETNDGPTLENRRQFQYYTTTSAISPTPMRNGISFSYQANTAEPRQWQMQRVDSVGRWNPLLGYGANQFAVHLGRLCVSSQGGVDISGETFEADDYFVAARYYNLNNEGFGRLERLSMNPATLGLNTYNNNMSQGQIPEQVGLVNITNGVPLNDDISQTNGAGEYIGKFTTPRCGKPDELYSAHTPTSANGREHDVNGNLDHYRAYIAFRNSLAEFDPLTDQSVVVRDDAEEFSLIWPTPIISWLERTGDDVEQQYDESIIDPQSPILAGLPHAQIGTAELYNTDRRSYDCWSGIGGMQPYFPGTAHSGNSAFEVVQNYDALTKVLPGGPCAPLAPSDILGIAINLTSNKIQGDFFGFTTDPDDKGYETGGQFNAAPIDKYFGGLETTKVLGVYDVRGQTLGNRPDSSFKALIPARVPFELHLLDSTYGLRLADVRSWHSLMPRETRTDCGGCHQHDAENTDAPPDYEDTYAAAQPATDFVKETPRVQYDAFCAPEMTSTPGESTHALKDWYALWNRFDQTCTSCHDANNPPPTNDGTAAFAYTDSHDAYRQMNVNFYANPHAGALGSPAFWAARGERTDGRNNSDYIGMSPSFVFSAVHATDPGITALCDGSDPDGANWLYDFGQWIDNNMPRSQAGHPYNYYIDRYHPSVDFAIKTNTCTPTKIRIGHWDDSDGIESLEVLVDGVQERIYTEPLHDLSNAKGKRVHTFSTPGITSDSSVTVIAMDANDNRQVYTKSIRELEAECKPATYEPHGNPIPVP